MSIPPLKGDDGKDYYVIYVSPYQSESIEVLERFSGRDWRRIKRELRKVSDRHRVNSAPL